MLLSRKCSKPLQLLSRVLELALRASFATHQHAETSAKPALALPPLRGIQAVCFDGGTAELDLRARLFDDIRIYLLLLLLVEDFHDACKLSRVIV